DSYKTKRNTNVLVLGASGTGKSRSYIMPNLLELDASTATTDPKGELARAARTRLEERNIKIRTLNLINLKQSDHFNPMRYFNPDEVETGIMQLVESIIMNTTGKESHGDQFFERAERALLTALVAYEWATTAVFDGQEPNLPGVLDLQQGMDGSEENKDSLDSETDIKFQAAREIVEEWKINPDPDDDEQVMQVLDFACRLYRIYEQGAVETRKSIVISLGVRLSPLEMHDIRHILSTDTLAIDKLGYEPTALFLQIPDTHSTFKFVAAMFWQSMFEQTVYQADHEEAGRLPRMLHMFLDEFANIGKLPEFDKKMATIRSRGISASVVMQSYSQGKALFKDEWDGIVGNCDTTLFLGTNDTQTSEWISKRLGNETVISQDNSRSYGATGSWSKSDRTMKRPLMEPDEVARLDDDLAIVLIRGLRPYKSKKIGA
ncbi:MAG: VirD4-like conjugal transfer protein, CD1115 family, partial [Gammaproteobacteria bacterium]